MGKGAVVVCPVQEKKGNQEGRKEGSTSTDDDMQLGEIKR